MATKNACVYLISSHYEVGMESNQEDLSGTSAIDRFPAANPQSTLTSYFILLGCQKSISFGY